jgi:hypothetical protein
MEVFLTTKTMPKKANNPQNLVPIPKNKGGRPKGVKNKVPTEIKAHFLYVFETLQKNPKTSLLTTAKEKPEWFYDLSRALLPKEIKADITASSALIEIARQALAARGQK